MNTTSKAKDEREIMESMENVGEQQPKAPNVIQ